jgi:hypothetical protein
MEYNYLMCDGPNCEQKLDLRNTGSGDQDTTTEQTDQPDQSDQAANVATVPSNEPAAEEQLDASDHGPPAYQGSWLNLDTGAQVFHFCTYECLTAFVNDPDGPDNAIKHYAEFFGYES